ncbi:MAG: addiction module protein [Bryobacterales bacterium]|nr:addiction module protein [Bryobacterales bacterium]
MSHRNISDLLELPVSERIQLVEDLWDSIVEVPGALPVTEEQGRELDRRLEAHKESPDDAVPWGEVRKRLIERL